MKINENIFSDYDFVEEIDRFWTENFPADNLYADSPKESLDVIRGNHYLVNDSSFYHYIKEDDYKLKTNGKLSIINRGGFHESTSGVYSVHNSGDRNITIKGDESNTYKGTSYKRINGNLDKDVKGGVIESIGGMNLYLHVGAFAEFISGLFSEIFAGFRFIFNVSEHLEVYFTYIRLAILNKDISVLDNRASVQSTNVAVTQVEAGMMTEDIGVSELEIDVLSKEVDAMDSGITAGEVVVSLNIDASDAIKYANEATRISSLFFNVQSIATQVKNGLHTQSNGKPIYKVKPEKKLKPPPRSRSGSNSSNASRASSTNPKIIVTP